MRIAVIGPTHPYKGGIAQYTTELAHRLTALGHEVRLESWSHQYPSRLYPGRLTIDKPELPPFPRTHRRLSWRRPDSWYACGRRLRDHDLVVLVVASPVQMPAYRGVLAGLGRRRRARVVTQCHNVLPHERRPSDEALISGLLTRVDGVLTHSDDQARIATSLTGVPVVAEQLAPLVVARATSRVYDGALHRRLLFFGLVRPYKGVDVLLRALAAGPPDVALTVAGEFWGDTPAVADRMVRELGLSGRVELRPGYVEAEQVPALFRGVDALALPYRSVTASVNPYLAFEHGVPVIASRIGTLPDDVQDGVDGLLVVPDDVDSLTSALRRLYTDDTALRLRAAVCPPDAEPQWSRYLKALTSFAEDRQ
ncbi:glycosyltransferase family 4 protein [Actinophytocola gossypii]|uniref:Glycosyltransferase n=1 Tax=Actinophytocola gossypii TaxID=2812003 RepID=A0ABT2J993_9PSEU|nr:glycosyltransferase [Actinophytocola gossypii]MCT2584020.1 glycosyltransferase [Actinophytocola gossypii]